MIRCFIVFIAFFNFVFAAELKIATFNVENLFDAHNDGSEYRDFVIGKSSHSKDKYIKKLISVSNHIKTINADIIAVQEIENYGVLKKLASLSGYSFFQFAGDKDAPFGIGIMSKIKIEDSKQYEVYGVKTRKILRTDFKFNHNIISVFNVHFPSAKNGYSQRLKAMNTLISALKNVKNAIVVGDFNTAYKDRLFNKIYDMGFVNLWATIPKHDRKSHISNRAIDQVLLSKDFFSAISYKHNSFFAIDNLHKISDHFLLHFDISSDSFYSNLEEIKIEQLFDKKSSKPFLISKASVVYVDNYGFVISKDGNGIYVYDDLPRNLIKGSVADFYIAKIDTYKNNTEIKALIPLKIYDEKINIKKDMAQQEDLPKFKHGGYVLDYLEGYVHNGYLQNEYFKVKLYSHKLIPDGKYRFENVYLRMNKDRIEAVIK